MTTQTEINMTNKERQTLEQDIVDRVRKLSALTNTNHFTIPYRNASGGIGYVMVGANYPIMVGMLAQARKQAGGK